MTALKQLLLALACVAWIVPGVHVLHASMDDLNAAFSRFWSGTDPSAAAKASTAFTRGVFLMDTSRFHSM